MKRETRMKKNIGQIRKILKDLSPTIANERIVEGVLANLAYSVNTFARIYRDDDHTEDLP